jgi:hypothetical protein
VPRVFDLDPQRPRGNDPHDQEERDIDVGP